MENLNKQITKEKIFGFLLFGFKLLSVKNVHKSISLKVNPKIQLFSKLSNSTKHRKILCLLQHILDAIKEKKENIFYLIDQINLKQVKFKICNNLYNISFGQLNIIEKAKKIEAVVKSLNKNYILKEAYRFLAQIENNILCEDAVSSI